jgi:hypothetical protein
MGLRLSIGLTVMEALHGKGKTGPGAVEGRVGNNRDSTGPILAESAQMRRAVPLALVVTANVRYDREARGLVGSFWRRWMGQVEGSLPQALPQFRRSGETARTDAWWVQPTVVVVMLSGFIVYATWAAFQGAHYSYAGGGAQYLSPFYSPELWGNSPHALFGPKPGWLPWPKFLAFSPALLILWAPGGFRFTCYYYRGAYYKAFWRDPPSCAVGEPGFRGSRYRGENSFPLILQNAHRYFLYVSVIVLLFLAFDAWKSFWFIGADSRTHFGVGIGSLVLTLNFILLSSYTLSCHSMRHLVGGVIDRLSGHPVRKRAYDCVSCLNRRHMLIAWVSLVWVAFSDVYVRMCSMGVWRDFRIF